MNYRVLYMIFKFGLILAVVGALKLATIFLAGKAAMSVQRGVMSYSKFTKMLTNEKDK